MNYFDHVVTEDCVTATFTSIESRQMIELPVGRPRKHPTFPWPPAQITLLVLHMYNTSNGASVSMNRPQSLDVSFSNTTLILVFHVHLQDDNCIRTFRQGCVQLIFVVNSSSTYGSHISLQARQPFTMHNSFHMSSETAINNLNLRELNSTIPL